MGTNKRYAEYYYRLMDDRLFEKYRCWVWGNAVQVVGEGRDSA